MALPSLAELQSLEVLPYEGHFKPEKCSDAEIENLFLFNTRRRRIWQNFLRWRSRVQKLFGSVTFWVDGSFITSKEEPHDLDVVAIVSVESHSNAQNSHLQELNELRTRTIAGGGRLQPYGGFIDAFIIPCDSDFSSNASLIYFDNLWSEVNASKGYISEDITRKKYVEVRG